MKYMIYYANTQFPFGIDAWSDRRAIEWAHEDAKLHNLVVKKVKNFITEEIVYQPVTKGESA